MESSETKKILILSGSPRKDGSSDLLCSEFMRGAQMKIIIDRSLARWTNIPNKEFYFIMTCADDNRAAMACTLECFRGFTAYLNGAKEKGVIYGTGVYRPGEVMSSPAMKEAYEMGKNV